MEKSLEKAEEVTKMLRNDASKAYRGGLPRRNFDQRAEQSSVVVQMVVVARELSLFQGLTGIFGAGGLIYSASPFIFKLSSSGCLRFFSALYILNFIL